MSTSGSVSTVARPDRSTHSSHSMRPATTSAVLAVLVAFGGLSLGSTMAKSSGSPGPVVAFWRFLIAAVLWHAFIAIRGARTGTVGMRVRGRSQYQTIPRPVAGRKPEYSKKSAHRANLNKGQAIH